MLKSMQSKFCSVCSCGCLETIKRNEGIIYDTERRKAYKSAHAPHNEAEDIKSYVQAQEEAYFDNLYKG